MCKKEGNKGRKKMNERYEGRKKGRKKMKEGYE